MIDVQNMSIHSFRIVPKHLFLGRTTLKTRVPFPFASKSLFIAASDKILLIKFSFGTTFFPSFGEGKKKKRKRKKLPLNLSSKWTIRWLLHSWEVSHRLDLGGRNPFPFPSLCSRGPLEQWHATAAAARGSKRRKQPCNTSARCAGSARKSARKLRRDDGWKPKARGRPCASVNGRRRRYTASIWIFACTWSRRGQLPALQYVHNWGEHAPPLYISPPLVSLFYLRSLLCLSIRELLSTCLVSLLAPSSLILFLFFFLEQEEGEFSGGIYFLSVYINFFSFSLSKFVSFLFAFGLVLMNSTLV